MSVHVFLPFKKILKQNNTRTVLQTFISLLWLEIINNLNK
jgi:hypothetical protein